MVSIENDTQIGRKWAAQINRVRPRQCVASHRKHFLDGRTAPVNPQTLSELKAARHEEAIAGAQNAEVQHGRQLVDQIGEEVNHGKKLVDRIEEIFGMAYAGYEKYMRGDDANSGRTAAAFLTIAKDLTIKLTPPPQLNEPTETESDGFIEALKVTAKDDWKEARTVQMAATKQKTEDGPELVDLR